MVPLELTIGFIVAQCLYNLFSIAVLSKESRRKDEDIADLSKKLVEKDEVIANLSKTLGGR